MVDRPLLVLSAPNNNTQTIIINNTTIIYYASLKVSTVSISEIITNV